MSKNQQEDPTAIEKTLMKINILKNEVGMIQNHDYVDRRTVQGRTLNTTFTREKREWQLRYGKEMDQIKRTENQIHSLDSEIQAIESENKQLGIQVEDLKEEHEENLKKSLDQYRKEKVEVEDELKVESTRFRIIDEFIHQGKSELIQEVSELEERLENQKRLKKDTEVQKDEEKTRATDKLKKYMLESIQTTKTDLFALRKEQLDSKTRLTVLQNYQLTTELEYQSKQTENLFFKNQKLIQHVSALKRDVEIHKQVEGELAKRSHFCQKLIKKLKTKLKSLELEKDEYSAEILNNKKMVVATADQNKKNVEKLALMKNDKTHFLEKLDISKTEYEFTKNVGKQRKQHLSKSIRHLKVLLKLYERNLVVSGTENTLQKSNNNNNDSQLTQSESFIEEDLNRARGGQETYRQLNPDQKEAMMRGIVAMLNSQLEEYGALQMSQNQIQTSE